VLEKWPKFNNIMYKSMVYKKKFLILFIIFDLVVDFFHAYL